VATTFCALYAHKIHFRVLIEKEDKISGIAAFVWQQDRGANSISTVDLIEKPYIG
jgi:hypothetical protein